MVNPNDPAAIPYVITEDDGAFWYIAYKEKNPGVPYITVSSKGVANGLSTEYNDGYDFGPDSYNPNISSGIPLTQTSGIQEACAYAYSIGQSLPFNGKPGVINTQLTVYLVADSTFVLNTSVHFLSTESVWHNIVSASRGTAIITAPAGSTFPFFVVDDGFGEDLQFRGLQTFPQTSSQSVLYYGGTAQLFSDYHFEDCYFAGNVGEIDIDLASINQFTMNQCFGGFVISIKAIINFCHINNSVMNATGNVLIGNGAGLSIISITDTEAIPTASVGSSTTFLSVGNCNLSIDGLILDYPNQDVLLGIGTGTNLVKLSRISTTNPPLTGKLLSAQPTYLEIDNSLIQPYQFADYPYYPNSTTNGTTAGTVNMIFMENTPIYKKLIITFTGYENDTTTDQTIDFPIPFNTYLTVSLNITGLTIPSFTKSSMTIAAPDSTTTYSGFMIFEGY